MRKKIVYGMVVLLLSLILGLGLLWLLQGTIPFTKFVRYKESPASCLFYAIDESQRQHTQFFSIHPTTKKFTKIGSLKERLEFNAIDIDPKTNLIYTNADTDGTIYKLDAQTGATAAIGVIPYANINSLAFQQTAERSVWGWAEEKGLVKIDTITGTTALMYESLKPADAITWDSNGKYLYVALEDATELYAYEPENKTFTLVIDNLPHGTESLITLSDGLLLGASNEASDKLIMYIYDMSNQEVLRTQTYQTNGFELTGISWPRECGIPF